MAVVSRVSDVMCRSMRIFLSSSKSFLLLSLLLLCFRSILRISTISLLSSLDNTNPSSLPSRFPTGPPRPHHHHYLDGDQDPSLHLEYFNSSHLITDEPFFRVINIVIWKPPNTPLVFHQHGSPPRSRLFFRGSDLLYLATFFAVLQAYAISGFVIFYSLAFGVVFYAVACALMGLEVGFLQNLSLGSRLGMRRLPVFLFLFWALRDASVQLLSLMLFSGVHGGINVAKLFVKVKLLPFTKSALPPLVRVDHAGVTEFIVLWSLLDTAITIVFMVVFCIAMMRHNSIRRGGTILKEACTLVSNVTGQVIFINCLEVLVCRDGGRKVLTAVGGAWVSEVVQSIGEVYFMVVWLVFYFVVKSRAGESHGRRFRWREVLLGNNIWR